MKISNCLNCGKYCNADISDAWVCPECGALYQSLMEDCQCGGKRFEIITDNGVMEFCYDKLHHEEGLM